MSKLHAATVLALSLFGADIALAETPVTGGGLPPLPQPQGRDAEIMRLERERDALRREARDLGGGRSISDSIRNVRNAFYEKKYQADRLEEMAQDMGYTRDELRAKQKEILNSEGFGAVDFTGGQIRDKATEELLKRAVSELLGKAFGLYSAADTVVDVGKRIERWRLRRETAGNLGDNIRTIRANWTAMNQMLIALYGELAIEAARLRRLEEIRRRDREIFERVALLQQPAVRGARLDRVRDSEYDDVLFEIERLEFERRIADLQGKTREVRRLSTEIDRLERQLRQLEQSGYLGAGAFRAASPGQAGLCATYGAGFFYIPGTETCLQIGGHVRYSGIGSPSTLGGHTVRTLGGGAEGFGYALPGWVDRFGAGLDFTYGLGQKPGAAVFPEAYRHLFGSLDFALGRESGRDRSEVGVDADIVAHTFGQPDPVFGTGRFAGAPGFGVSGWGKLDNNWVLGTFGVGKSFLDGEDDDFYPTLRFGGFVETINYHAFGRSRITFNGVDIPGEFQRYDYRSNDFYLGALVGVDLHYAPVRRLNLSFGADLLASYHWSSARFDMETGAGGANVVTETFTYDWSGVSLGATLRAGAQYAITERLSLGIGYKWSIVPGVVAAHKPSSPLDQPFRYTSETVQRHEAYLRMNYSF